MLNFEEFAALVAAEMEYDVSILLPSARLVEDLGFDSLEFLRLCVIVYCLVPIDLPEDLDLHDVTLGDVHYYYDAIGSRLSGG